MSVQGPKRKAFALKRMASGKAQPWAAICEAEFSLRFCDEDDLAQSIERSCKLGSELGLLVDDSIGFFLDLGQTLPGRKLEWAVREIRNSGLGPIIQVWSKRLAVEAFLACVAARESREIASSVPEQGSRLGARKNL